MNSTVRIGTLMPTPRVSVPQMTFSRPGLGQRLDQPPVPGQHPGVVHADAVPDQPGQGLAEPAENRKPPITSAMASFSARLQTLTLISACACSIAAAWVKCTT